MAVVYDIMSHNVLKKGVLKTSSDEKGFITIDIDTLHYHTTYYRRIKVHKSSFLNLLKDGTSCAAKYIDTKYKKEEDISLEIFEDDDFTVLKIIQDRRDSRWQFHEEEINLLKEFAVKGLE